MVSENSLKNLKMFSSQYQPPTLPGRKPSTLKKYIKDANVSREDVAVMIRNVLFTKNFIQLKELVEDASTPMVVRLFVKAFLTDFKNGSLANFSVLMDRAFGAPKQDVTVSGEIAVNITAMTYEQRQGVIDEYLKKRGDNVQGGGAGAAGEPECIPGRFEEAVQAEPGEAEKADS